MEMHPEGPLAVLFVLDQPGVIGKVGGTLGDAGVNIAHMTFGRKRSTQRAVLSVNLDTPPPREVMDELSAMDFTEAAYAMDLPAMG